AGAAAGGAVTDGAGGGAVAGGPGGAAHGEILGQEGAALGGGPVNAGGVSPQHAPVGPTGQGPVIEGGGEAGGTVGGHATPPSNPGSVIQTPGDGGPVNHGGTGSPVIQQPVQAPAHSPVIQQP